MQRNSETQDVNIVKIRKREFTLYTNQSLLEDKEKYDKNGLPKNGIYKLHISISKDQYQNPSVKKNLVALLNNAIANDTIKMFKHTNEDYLQFVIDDHFFEFSQNNTAFRFLEGDQFTVYIPLNCDIKKLEKLCNDINTLLIDVKPGNVMDVSSPISPHINIRQDQFETKDGQYRYIPVFPKTEQDLSILENAKKEMENNEIYLALKNNLNQEHAESDSYGLKIINENSEEDIKFKYTLIEKPSIDPLEFAKLFSSLVKFNKLISASGLGEIIEILNENWSDLKKLHKIVDFATYKKSDSKFAFNFHKHVRARSPLAERIYQILSTFDKNKNPDATLKLINKEFQKIISKLTQQQPKPSSTSKPK